MPAIPEKQDPFFAKKTEDYPFVFGRGGEEMELLLENGIPVDIVPGITACLLYTSRCV